MKNGDVFGSTYERAAEYFLSTCAPEPEAPGEAEAYRFITGMYNAFKEPAALGLKAEADKYFAPWEQQKGREKDIKSIRGSIDKIDSAVAELFDLTESGTVSSDGLRLTSAPGRLLGKALAAVCGISDGVLPMSAECAAALKRLTEVSRQNTIHITDGAKQDKAHLFFSRCVFNPQENWTAPAFDRLLDADGRLLWLCEQLEARGYTRTDCREGKKVSLDYHKQLGKKAEPLKAAWGERTHLGIEVSFEELRLEPCFVWIRMPMFKTVLQNLGGADKRAAEFILASTKTCDGCRYCVNTDKTGTRPLAAVNAGEMKCPYYPGFSMNWRTLTQELAENIIMALDTAEGILS